jgi:mono/diheme cytochrome c family protein
MKPCLRAIAWLPAAWLFFASLSLWPGRALADEPVDYVRQIKPVLQERCYACHGPLKQEAGLRLDTAALAIKGGESGAAIAPQNAESSLLVAKVTAADDSERMPPEGERLSGAQIALVKAWITQGAKSPADEQPLRDPRDHWAFKPPVRPPVPQVAVQQTDGADWNQNPIDAFLAAEHERRGLAHQGPADRRIWLRRVSIDLVGLPPTRAELDAFLADESPQAYETVVARLLDSLQYGERWGRHWMDILRYSDWWGLGPEVRNSQKHLWHWRDWLIESFNADKGYDQMLREMLAADELYPTEPDRLRATGFLARQYFRFNRTSWLDETVEHTSKAMLGLTFNCCKCHDHKYDPLAQTDYYRLRAVFEPYQVRTDMAAGEIDFDRDGIPRAFDCNLDAPTFLHIRGDDRNPDKSHALEPAVPAFLAGAAWQLAPVSLPPEGYDPGLRPQVVEAHLKAAERKIAAARSAVETARANLDQSQAAEKLASEKTTADNPAAETALLVKDDFAAERPDVWEQSGGQWKYVDGKLVQNQVGATRAVMRLKQAPPENFEARLRFRITGGQTWKSVGIAFDMADPYEANGYLSAYDGGPKSQVCYKAGSDYTYPAEGAQSRKVELNRQYELTLRVRGTLVNLLVDGELSVAYELPVPRRRGAMQFLAFDATAEFVGFELRELPPDLLLAQGAVKPTDTPQSSEQAQLSVTIAQRALAVAEAGPAAIHARSAAQIARYQQPPAANTAELARAAVKAERIVAAAAADEALAAAELELARATADKRAEAEKKLAAAQAALAVARQAVDMPAEDFTPLAGALKTPESNLESEESRRKPYPPTSSGRRSAFANWLTDRRNPLAARVAVNHVWMRHFGRPLVTSVFDFGHKGAPPTHPELLDWLAVELVEHNWSFKHLHRLIVTSQAYRLSSSAAGAPATTLAADPENQFYWRANPTRMEAQVVRDSLLHLAGELDLTLGGPSIPVADEASRRRSLYFVHSHNEHQKFLSMFNDASVLDCYRRAESIVPAQALTLENSPLATAMAEKIAQRIAAANPGATDRDFLRAAFLTVLSVEPSEAELALAGDGLTRLTAAARQKGRPQPEVSARTSLIHALVNHNDFVTVR